MDLVPHHATLSPATQRGPPHVNDAAAAATAAAAAAATATAAVPPAASAAAAAAASVAAVAVDARSRRSRHRVHRHEAVQVRGHHHDQLQEEPADQPLSIKIQNQTSDHHRDHQRPGLPFGLQRGVQVRAGHREQTQVKVHEHDGARTKAAAAFAPVHQHGQHRRGQTPGKGPGRRRQAVFAAGRHQRRGDRQERDDETSPVHGVAVRAAHDGDDRERQRLRRQ